MRAVFHLARAHRVRQTQQLLGLCLPAGLDGRLACHGLEHLVAHGLRVRVRAVAQLRADLLERGQRIARVNLGGHAAQDVVAAAERLEREAELRERVAVLLQHLRVARVGREGQRLEQRLRRDVGRVLAQAVKVDALVRRVLVDEDERVALFHEDVGVHRLTDQAGGRRLRRHGARERRRGSPLRRARTQARSARPVRPASAWAAAALCVRARGIPAAASRAALKRPTPSASGTRPPPPPGRRGHRCARRKIPAPRVLRSGSARRAGRGPPWARARMPARAWARSASALRLRGARSASSAARAP